MLAPIVPVAVTSAMPGVENVIELESAAVIFHSALSSAGVAPEISITVPTFRALLVMVAVAISPATVMPSMAMFP
jgi:hypothetical protein